MGKIAQKLSSDEKSTICQYTMNSGEFNRPLAGFQSSWEAVVGDDSWNPKYKRGAKNVWIDYEDAGQGIRTLTKAIEKSKYDFDVWVRRDCSAAAMDSFFKQPAGVLETLGEEEIAGFVKYKSKMYNFISTAPFMEGAAGFAEESEVELRIFCPKGTQMLYTELFSAYGGAMEGFYEWDGIYDYECGTGATCS